MTAIAGFPGIGVPGDLRLPFVILGADSEETDGDGASTFSSSVRKIEVIDGESFKCILGGAGNGEFIDLAIQQARTDIQDASSLDALREEIEDIVTEIYTERIDQYPAHQQDDLAFTLLGAIWIPGSTDVQLIRIKRAWSLVQTKPTSIGLGRDLAHYILSNFCLPELGAYSLTRLMVYLLSQLKRYVPDVGGNTQIVVLDGKGQITELVSATIAQHELSTSTVSLGIKWLFNIADPMGFNYDMTQVDNVVDGVADVLKSELRKSIGGLAATQQSAAANAAASLSASVSESLSISDTPLPLRDAEKRE